MSARVADVNVAVTGGVRAAVESGSVLFRAPRDAVTLIWEDEHGRWSHPLEAAYQGRPLVADPEGAPYPAEVQALALAIGAEPGATVTDTLVEALEAYRHAVIVRHRR